MSPQYSRGARPESDHANFSLNHIDDDDGDDDYDEDNDDDDDDGGLLSSSRSLSSTSFPFQCQKLYLELARSLISSPLGRGQQVSHHFRRLFERFPSTSSFARRTNGSRPTASICFK